MDLNSPTASWGQMAKQSASGQNGGLVTITNVATLIANVDFALTPKVVQGDLVVVAFQIAFTKGGTAGDVDLIVESSGAQAGIFWDFGIGSAGLVYRVRFPLVQPGVLINWGDSVIARCTIGGLQTQTYGVRVRGISIGSDSTVAANQCSVGIDALNK